MDLFFTVFCLSFSVSAEERLRRSSESLPYKSTEITRVVSATVEGFDRSKSESDICDDLVSSSVVVDKSSLSTTTSDLSHGDSSLATWSGKSSSSKDMIDEPVLLLTDTEVASPSAKETGKTEGEVFPFCKAQESASLCEELSAGEATEGVVFTIASFYTDDVNEDSQSLTITEAGESAAMAEILAAGSSSKTQAKTLVTDDSIDTSGQKFMPADCLKTVSVNLESSALSQQSEAAVSPVFPSPKEPSVCVVYKDEPALAADADRKQCDMPIRCLDDVAAAAASKDELPEDGDIALLPSDAQVQNDATGALGRSEFGQQTVPIKSLDPLQILDEIIDFTDPDELLAAALAEMNRTIDSLNSIALGSSHALQNLQGDTIEPLPHIVPLSPDDPLSSSSKVARVPPHAVVSLPSSDILPLPMDNVLLSSGPLPPEEVPGELNPSQSVVVPLYVGQTPPSSFSPSEDFPPPPEDLQSLSSPFHFFSETVAPASSDSSTKAYTDEQTFSAVLLPEHKMAPVVSRKSPTSCQFSAVNVPVGLPCPDDISGILPPLTRSCPEQLEELPVESRPGPNTLAIASDVSQVCHQHPDMLSVDKAKPKPPPVMRKPPKPKGDQ